MRAQDRREAGETLLEICIAIVLIGLIVSSFFMEIQATANASTSTRDLVNADAVLRGYAEATKQAVRTTCTGANTGASVTPDYAVPPSMASITVSASGLTCPAPITVQQVDITALLPNRAPQHLSIEVRTP